MEKLEFKIKLTLGKCLNFLERSPVTADVLSLVGWCAIGGVAPAISAVAITGSFVSMGIMLAVENKGKADHKIGQILDLIVGWCSLMWYAPAIISYAVWYTFQPASKRAWI